jgi:hypothetical protein
MAWNSIYEMNKENKKLIIHSLRIISIICLFIGLLFTYGAWSSFQGGIDEANQAQYSETVEQQREHTNVAGRYYSGATALGALAAASFTFGNLLLSFTPPLFSSESNKSPDDNQDENSCGQYAS